MKNLVSYDRMLIRNSGNDNINSAQDVVEAALV